MVYRNGFTGPGGSKDNCSRNAHKSCDRQIRHFPNEHGAPMKTNRQSGFTLIELMVSLAVFLVIAGAAFSLFGAHAPLFSRQQNMAGVHITLPHNVPQKEMEEG